MATPLNDPDLLKKVSSPKVVRNVQACHLCGVMVKDNEQMCCWRLDDGKPVVAHEGCFDRVFSEGIENFPIGAHLPKRPKYMVRVGVEP